MKISLITINLNNKAGLAKTIESIMAQLPNLDNAIALEHIIVDGNSTDNSLDNLNPALNSLIISAPPKGIYNAINIGISHCTGDIVGLLHSGDVFVHDKVLSNIMTNFANNDSHNYVYGDIVLGRRYYSGANFTIKTLRRGFAPPHPSLYVRRSVYDIIGKYDENYKIAGDFDFFTRLLKTPELKGKYIPGVMVSMQKGGSSQKFSNRLWKNNTERLKSLKKNRISSNRLLLLLHYPKILKGYLCSSAKI